MTKTKALGAVLGIATGGLLLGGCHGHGNHHPDPAQVEKRIASHVEDTLDDLRATPDQRARIRAIQDRMIAEGRALHGSPGEVPRQVLAQWESPSPDVAALHALVDARTDALRAFLHKAVDAGAEVHAVLTPEQRAQLAKKLRRHLDG
jgi:periplasmic protein CpxP/Spy